MDALPVFLFDRSSAQGRLVLSDRDRLDLPHRMSTNDLKRLNIGEGCSTVLTTATARIIDRVIVYHRGETALMITNYPQIVLNWLRRHVFWQDRFRIEDQSAALGQLELHGAGAAALADGLISGAAALPLHHFREDSDHQLLVARTFPLLEEGFLIVAPYERLAQLRTAWSADGRVQLGDEALYERLRVAAGLAGAHHELTEDYIPLEAGLWDSVSFSKGCYIGQEIIARMESRNRLAKTLVKLHLSAPVPLGSPIQAADETVGVLTSLAEPLVPQAGIAAIGLGFVKPAFAAHGTRLRIGEVDAEVVPAPLISGRESE
ncbi:MAG: glycine cleavage system protein T [Candidatus Thermofonsia Clade 1 bacterium]|uniref:Glycine cleavage system protein T n=1 Tax=Candidatus Thermofonsia Clade 1 bacterium TaxID=2364210 RepID=A0A2M8NZF5_9CHLR|nr:MAG: glycine cleavage system protein T [Candidatus Thermofonsia Clade 1 bacterium]